MRLLLCKSQVVMGKYKSRKCGNLGGFIEVPITLSDSFHIGRGLRLIFKSTKIKVESICFGNA